MGRRVATGNQYWDGRVDELRISSTARSADWVAKQCASMTNSLITYRPEQTLP